MALLFDEELLVVFELVLLFVELLAEVVVLLLVLFDELVEFPPFVVEVLALFAVKCIFNVLLVLTFRVFSVSFQKSFSTKFHFSLFIVRTSVGIC